MPPKKKLKKVALKSSKTDKAIKPSTPEPKKKSSPIASTPRQGHRSGLRSTSATGSVRPLEDNPELILRKRQAPRKPGNPAPPVSNSEGVPKSLLIPKASKPKPFDSRAHPKSKDAVQNQPHRDNRSRSLPDQQDSPSDLPNRDSPPLAGDLPQPWIHQDHSTPLPDQLIQTIESSPTEACRQPNYEAQEEYYSDEEASPYIDHRDSEEVFNQRWGYLPQLDEEAIAVIEAIIANPDLARTMTGRIDPSKELFTRGLASRNVPIVPSKGSDPRADHIKSLELDKSFSETDSEKDVNERLWNLDQAKCTTASNEALFQRTVMMNVIGRHYLIYDRDDAQPGCLDFSVEETWTCPPMPTRAYWKGEQFLTQPKPDLAVCFRRESLMPDDMWNLLPVATQRLACYENVNEAGETRVFHFLTIEAKKGSIAADDLVALRQSLNNASQALHNMFEFFRDAGPEHEDEFFDKVRFFSVAVSTQGLVIRIHRAIREPLTHRDPGLIFPDRPDYPLRFEHREFLKILRESFDRKPVLEMFQRIMGNYGTDELFPLLQKAANAIIQKAKGRPAEMKLRESINFYLHGQTIRAPSSRKTTAANPRAGSSRATSVMSLDRLKRQTETPPATPPPKRLRGRSRGQPSPLGQDDGDRRSMSYQPEGLPSIFYDGNNFPRAQYLNTNEPLIHPQPDAAIPPGIDRGWCASKRRMLETMQRWPNLEHFLNRIFRASRATFHRWALPKLKLRTAMPMKPHWKFPLKVNIHGALHRMDFLSMACHPKSLYWRPL